MDNLNIPFGMEFTPGPLDDEGVLTLEGEFTVERALELKDALENALEQAKLVKVNLENVTEADLSCLQLLLSAHVTAEKSKRRLEITGGSEVFNRLVEDAGFIDDEAEAMSLFNPQTAGDKTHSDAC